MIDIVEELQVGTTVYLTVDTLKDFIYAEYIVIQNDYQGIKNNRAVLKRRSALKKQRYFREMITLEGFHLKFTHSPTPFKLYDDYNEMVKDFCKKLKSTPNTNIKLEKKMRSQHPRYFL